uniref:Immunoglobulin V-set domain-containing protein n=1 Tax=Hucho hucho TaxID=62062 RepID=A0A4W5KEH9_9TELE
CEQALCVVESAVTKEVVGGQVTVGCSFTWAGTNNKYFCKGTCSGEDILVETKGSKNVTQDRYSIEDKGDLFYVTIKDLRKTDSGTYWCGFQYWCLSVLSIDSQLLPLLHHHLSPPDPMSPQPSQTSL